MLKSWRSSLKTFPDKSPSLTAEKSEIKHTPQQIQVVKEVVVREFEEIKAGTPKIDENLKILGDLLIYLRKNRSMSLLMKCRQIERIEISNGVAEIFSDDNDINELVVNEKYKAELDTFFKERGLGFKIHEKVNEVSAKDILNEMLGGKLVVK